MADFNFVDLGLCAYADALLFQENLFNSALELKSKELEVHNHLIFVEHYPVYTLGKSGDANNLKVPVEESNAEYYQTSRGGDITYHGPGQLTIYPIFDLDSFNMGVRQYVETLEECIIDCLASYNIKTGRIKEASGVWIDADGADARKICAVGIKVSRGITMHGLAFNVNTDLNYFDNIVPCGIEGKGVSSLEKELGKTLSMETVKEQVLACFKNRFC